MGEGPTSLDNADTLAIHRYELDPSRLYATYFAGDKALGLPPDDEVRRRAAAHMHARSSFSLSLLRRALSAGGRSRLRGRGRGSR